MFKRAGVLFFYTLTPLHPGSGASVAAVDLPIQRERHTNFPMIQASGAKGALRDLGRDLLGITDEDFKDFRRLRDQPENSLNNEELNRRQELAKKILPWEIVFGPETDRASEHGGALALTDARILLFPIRSVRGVFTWITCQGVIERLKRDLAILKAVNAGQDNQALTELEEIQFPTLDPKARQASAPQQSQVVLENNQIILEDFCFVLPEDAKDKRDKAKRDEVGRLANWLAEYALSAGLDYWGNKLKTDLVILSDADFAEFVEMSTEVITRIKLGETGTVATGGLWDEEHLPSETLLYSLALATDPKLAKDQLKGATIENAEEVLNFLKDRLITKAKVMQFGGDETVGKGLVYVRYFDGRKASQKDQGQMAGGECRGEGN